MKLIYTVGLPASGKSTWARKYVIQNQDTVRVSRDDLRNMRGCYWLPQQEDMITQWENACIGEALGHGYNVIVDATNLNPKTVKNLEELAKAYEAEIEVKVFDTSLDICIMRDSCREDYVGEKVIREMSNKYNFPKAVEKNRATRAQDNKLPRAIIVDLDGTVALHNGRGPYDYNKCDTDLVNSPVAKIVTNYFASGETPCYIIYVTGREDFCKDKTLQWLKDNNLWSPQHCKLYMRRTYDRRKDCVIKMEIFEQYINNIYFVEFCIDDRTQVVELWRSLGLTCLQVADGNF